MLGPMDADAPTQRDLTRGYILVLALLSLALLTGLVGWIGGLGPPYREYGYDAAEDLSIMVAFLLLPFAVIAVWESRGDGIPLPLRILGWLLCTAGFLLPAVLLGITYLELPTSSAFGCGSLFNQGFDPSSFSPEDRAVVAGCEPIRASRLRLVTITGSAGAVAALLLAWNALLRSPPVRSPAP